MYRIKKIGVTLGTFFLLISQLAPSPIFAAADDNDTPGLNIGIPDFPRRVHKELPELSEDKQLKVGALRLHPAFTTKYEYDDNIKLSHTDKSSDSIFTQTPALGAEMKLGDHRIEGGYGMEIVNFAKDEEENAINHLAHALAEFNFNDLQITLGDDLEKSTSRLFSETSARDKLLINAAQALVRYDRPMWASEVGYTHNTINHFTTEFDNNDYNEDIVALLGGYKIQPKTLLLIETDLGNVYYKTNVVNADQKYIQLLTGVRGDLTDKITTTIKMGFQRRRVGDVGGVGPLQDYNGFVSNSDLVYHLKPTDTARLGYVRNVKTSTFGNNSWYVQDQVYTSYKKQFFQKWFLTPQISWQRNDYPESATLANETRFRADNFWQASVDLRYQIQEWLWTSAYYNFRNRNSNFDSLDFNNNRFGVNLTFAF